ncbi:MAG TPA: beta-galactosidase, partial [Halanaerobiales bacterium]|nr:beta-galactosidase [Halanaerobiales bacterium]
MRQILNFNTEWQYLPEDNKKMKDISYSNSKIEDISIPHSNKLVPHHYFNHTEYEFISWYRRPFYLDESYEDKKILVKFDGIMKKAEVFVNGTLVGTHKGGYTSFKLDITDYVNINEN